MDINSKDFKYAYISNEYQNCVKEINQYLKENDIEKYNIFINRLKTLKENDSKLRVSFVGQYNAGKSTIIKILSKNNNVQISSNIQTDIAKDYEWNDIIITDTPGICTEKQDHDEITYSKMEESDLIVYCVTNELFDDLILNNFKKIAYDMMFKNKLMIVVNKMTSENSEYRKNLNVYLDSINEYFPYSITEDFDLSFIEANSYIDGCEYDDDYLIELSNFSDFIEKLNKFISKRGIIGRLDTPIRQTISAIDDIIIDNHSKEKATYLNLLKKIENLIIRYKERTESKAINLTRKLYEKIIEIGEESLVKMLDNKIKSDKIQAEVETKIDSELIEATDNIYKVIDEGYKELETALDKLLLEDELCGYVINEINIGNINIPDVTLIKLGKIIKIVKYLEKQTTSASTYIGNLSNSKGKWADLKMVAGSDLHETIKTVGHVFKYKFKPWEALKLSKNISNAFKVIGPAVAAIAVLFDVIDLVNEELNEKKIIDHRKEMHNEFVSIAESIKKDFKEELNKIINNTFTVTLKQIDTIKSESIKFIESKEKTNNRLNSEREKLFNLLSVINDIQ